MESLINHIRMGNYYTVIYKIIRKFRIKLTNLEDILKIKSIQKRNKTSKNARLNNKDIILREKIFRGDWEEKISCNYCDSNRNKTYLINKKIDWYGRPFKLVECLDCRLVFADPRPIFDTILNFYIYSDFSNKLLIDKVNRPNVNKIHRKIVEKALSYNENAKSLFDVGTGAGTLLMEARAKGLEVSGNDINGKACEWLNKLGIKTYNIPTNKLEIESKFDIITMLDYIEHTYTPYNDLKWAYEHINSNGILYLKTLYLGCPNHNIMKENWNLFGEGHFHYYYPFVLNRIIHDVGFRIVEQKFSDEINKIIAKKIN